MCFRDRHGRTISIIEEMADSLEHYYCEHFHFYIEFGRRLGVHEIVWAHPDDPKRMFQTIFKSWLSGSGWRPVSWHRLIVALHIPRWRYSMDDRWDDHYRWNDLAHRIWAGLDS